MFLYAITFCVLAQLILYEISYKEAERRNGEGGIRHMLSDVFRVDNGTQKTKRR